MEGVVTLAQEGRFQLIDDRGIGHLFMLSHGAAAEASQLRDLERRQARVRVAFEPSKTLIANVAKRIELCA